MTEKKSGGDKKPEKPAGGLGDLSKDDEKKFDAEWRKLEKAFVDAKVHPTCTRVLALMLADDGVTWRKDWDKPMVDQLHKLLEGEAKDRKQLRKFITDLIFMASFVEHELKRPEMAYGLIILLNDAVIRYKLEVDVEGKFEEASANPEKAKLMTGEKARPVPAKVGEKAPEGTVRPNMLKGGKRRI